MKWMKRTALVLVAGAAFSLSATAPASAAPVVQGAVAAGEAVAQTDSNLIEVRRRGGRYFHRGWGGRRHFGHWGGRRHFGAWRGRRHYGHYRHRHWRGRRHRGFWFAAPFLAAPFIYNDGYYGYGYGNSCYRVCRAYHSRRYCRWHWRRYC